MSIQIYNSLTKKKEPLIPLEDKIIRMYSCGVTVYDQCHIGHARSLYVFDVIRRYLKYRGYDVRFVRNITDIDDKIIRKANELGVSSQRVSEENIGKYYRDLDVLGVGRADMEPKATENIPEMIQHIQGLMEKGFAYTVEGDVYFSVRKFSAYGKLSGQSVEKMLEGVRIEKDDKKQDPLDFALWKRSKEGEPSWSSPWGDGRPGWHIECSCMSLKHLNCKTLDIHAGGRDLIFPHHENEIAQAEALTRQPFAKYWIHHGLLTINGQKMAKSLGNFITVQEAVRKYAPDDLKLFFLSSHYASPIDFSDDKLQDAHKSLQRFAILAQEAGSIDPSGLEGNPDTQDILDQYRQSFIQAMDDDFNTPKALGCLFELVTEANKHKDRRTASFMLYHADQLIRHFCREVFGLSEPSQSSGQTDAEIQQYLTERETARQKKDFRRSDEIRDILKQKGIIVEDTPQGQRWRRE